MKSKKEASKKDVSKDSQSIIKWMVSILCILLTFVGFLSYQLVTSEALGSKPKQVFSSFFKEEEKLIPLDEFTVQLADGSYAKLSISIGYFGKEDKITSKKPILRDKIIFEMMKMNRSQLDVSQIEKTKEQLVREMNSSLQENTIQHVYIDNLVLQ